MNTSALFKTTALILCIALPSCPSTSDRASAEGGSESDAAAAAKEFPSGGNGQRLEPAFDARVAKDAQMEKLAEGLEWTEGPVWVKDGSKIRKDTKGAKGGFLLFSDIPNNVINQWTPEGGIKPYLKPAGYTGADARGGEMGTNGLTLDAQE